MVLDGFVHALNRRVRAPLAEQLLVPYIKVYFALTSLDNIFDEIHDIMKFKNAQVACTIGQLSNHGGPDCDRTLMEDLRINALLPVPVLDRCL